MKAASSASFDENGDRLFFKTIAPFLSSVEPPKWLEFRQQLTSLVQKYAYPSKK